MGVFGSYTYYKALMKFDRKKAGLDWKTIQRETGRDGYRAVDQSSKLTAKAVKLSLSEEKPEDHWEIFKANEQERHARSASLGNEYMQQTAYWQRRRLERQPVMEAVEDE